MLASQVRAILNLPALERFQFQCGQTPIHTTDYHRIRDAIPRRIRVRPLFEAAAVPGFYAPTTMSEGRWRRNCFYLKASGPEPPIHTVALVIHEATHAIQDGMGSRRDQLAINRIELEIAAFTAQAMYYVTQGVNWLTYAREYREATNDRIEKPQDTMLRVTQEVAQRIYDGRGPRRVSLDERHTIRQSILLIPQYARNAADTLTLDGF